MRRHLLMAMVAVAAMAMFIFLAHDVARSQVVPQSGSQAAPQPATAPQSSLFDEVNKDFGSVPRGTLLTHQFTLTNVTSAPLHITHLRTSCVCTTATVARQELQPSESTPVTVVVDTRKFSGQRVFTVFVHIDRPFAEEARILVQANSRDDVMLEPGQLSFGRVKKGNSSRASVVIEYHGQANWQILGIENDNGYLHPQVTKLTRPVGQVAYQLDVTLREDTPVGAWHADMWLKTNDAATPRIRVPLVVEVEGTLTATPTEVLMGQVRRGDRNIKRVVIRGPAPFRIVRIDGTDELVQVTPSSDEAKQVQVLKITINPGKEPGEVMRKLHVVTDLPNEDPVEFTVQASVSP